MKRNFHLITASVLAGALLALALFTFWEQGKERETHGPSPEQSYTTPALIPPPVIKTMQVENTLLPGEIELRGRLRPARRLQLYAGTAGTLLETGHPLKEGVRYRKGQQIIQIDAESAEFHLHSSRSGFQKLVSSLLPELRMDYPESSEPFEAWFRSINPEQRLPELPPVSNEQLRLYLISRGVYDQHYRIRSAEKQLESFLIHAPFDGVLSEVRVEPGQNVTPQTSLATFIDDSRFELIVSLPPGDVQWLSIGQTVELTEPRSGRIYPATIDRIHPSMERNTQSIPAYLTLSGAGLREGLYLEGVYRTEPRGMATIPRSALLRTGHVYSVDHQGVVRMTPVHLVGLDREQVQVSGLEEARLILVDFDRPMAGYRLQPNGEGR